jgi:putative ABC transport system permease protein
MLQNYLKIAWRRLIHHKVESVISIVGLAIGIACCTLLLLSVRYEFSFDSFNQNEDQLFRVINNHVTKNGKKRSRILQVYPLASALDATFPSIKHVVRMEKSAVWIKSGHKFYVKHVLFAGPAFFQMFTFPLISGNKKKALKQPHSIVLTESTAKKLFHTDQVLGKTITLRRKNDVRTFKVTGVAKDVPQNSSITFTMVLPFSNSFWGFPKKEKKMLKSSWRHSAPEVVWVELQKNASLHVLEAQFPSFVKKHYPNWKNRSLNLQPINNIYFGNQAMFGFTQHANVHTTIILAIIAIIILAIAGFNFISLTLSRISGRQSEMGIRKSVGALRRQLSIQLMSEIFITCGISVVLGMVLAQLVSPFFTHFIQKPLPVHLFTTPAAWGIMAGILFAVTLITGTYPAWFIYQKSPVLLFRSRRSANRIPRIVKGLIIVQFTLSIAFLITTVTMQTQLHFMLHGKNLGYSTQNVISIQIPSANKKGHTKATLYYHRVRKITGVQNASISDVNYNLRVPKGGGMTAWHRKTTLQGLDGRIAIQYVGSNFIQTLGIELLKGHDFSGDRIADLKNGIIVNKKFIKATGIKHPIGYLIHDEKSKQEEPLNGKRIIGVMDNYNFSSLSQKVNPLVLQYINTRPFGSGGAILVKLGNGSVNSTIKKMRNLWDKILPHAPFKYRFLNDLLAAQYQTQKRWGAIMKMASAVAVLLACFGLFGLAMLAVNRRTKEIGIRKVLGASEASIVKLLSKDFLKLVAIGFVIAVPIGWYAMHRWLQNFAYKINMSWWIFLLAGGIALLIALATVSWQSVRAALANPVDSLRSE